jgi:hypothetical protein
MLETFGDLFQDPSADADKYGKNDKDSQNNKDSAADTHAKASTFESAH